MAARRTLIVDEAYWACFRRPHDTNGHRCDGDHIVKNAENVCEKFPNEARKMHYCEIEHRPIYGEASPEEAKSLIEEGVEVSPLPVLPEDRN